MTNLQAQVGNSDFNDCQALAQTVWNQTLSRVEVRVPSPEGEVADQLVRFYTALYHAHNAPTQYNEVISCISVWACCESNSRSG